MIDRFLYIWTKTQSSKIVYTQYTVHIMFNCQNHSQLFGKNISCLGFWNCQEHLFASIPILKLVLWFSPWYIDHHIGSTAMRQAYVRMSDHFTPFSWFRLSFGFIRLFTKYMMKLLSVKIATKQVIWFFW